VGDRTSEIVAIKPPIERNGFTVALRDLGSGFVESSFAHRQLTDAVCVTVTETYSASRRGNLRTSTVTF
jgi:hypothetical protein